MTNKWQLTNVFVTAIQDGLIATDGLGYTSESLNNSQSQLLPLLSLINGNILDMPNSTEISQELLLNENVPSCDNLVGALQNNDNREVRLVGLY